MDLTEGKSGVFDLSLKPYHEDELQLGYQQFMTEAHGEDLHDDEARNGYLPKPSLIGVLLAKSGPPRDSG